MDKNSEILGRNKLVNREKLVLFGEMLEKLGMKILGSSLKSEFDELQLFFKKYILDGDKESLNAQKKLVYSKMKAAGTEEENKYYYDLYQFLKTLTE